MGGSSDGPPNAPASINHELHAVVIGDFCDGPLGLRFEDFSVVDPRDFPLRMLMVDGSAVIVRHNKPRQL